MFFKQAQQPRDHLLALLDSESQLQEMQTKQSKCSEILQIKLESPSIIQLNQNAKSKIPILITLQTKDLLQEINERVGIDLVCVIDVSGSMKGKPLELVKQSLSALVKLLGPSDRLSLVTFSGEAQLLTPLLALTQENKESMQNTIKGLKASGGTEIAAGVGMAAQVFQSRKQKNGASFMFLLSDGNDNEKGTVKRVHDKMKDVQNVGIYTFGYGENNEAKIMSEITGVGVGGHYYFIKRQQDVEEFFVMALGGCVSVFVWDAKVKMVALHGKIHHIFATQQEENEQIWRVGALLFGKQKQLVIEMEFEGQLNDSERQRKCLEVEFSGNEIRCGSECKMKAELVCKFAFEGEDEEVAEQSEDLIVNYFVARGKECIEKLSEKIEIVEDISDNEDDFQEAVKVLEEQQNELDLFQHKDNEKIKQFQKCLKIQLKAYKKHKVDQKTKNRLSRQMRQMRSRSASISSASNSGKSRSGSRSGSKSGSRSGSRSRSISRSRSRSGSRGKQKQPRQKYQRKMRFSNLNQQQREWTVVFNDNNQQNKKSNSSEVKQK